MSFKPTGVCSFVSLPALCPWALMMACQMGLPPLLFQWLESLQVTSLLAALPPSWWSFVSTQSNIPNQTFVKLLGKIFQESTTRQTSDNHFSESATLFVENKGKFKGIKNQIFHNVSLVLELQTITRNFIRTRSVTIVGRKTL